MADAYTSGGGGGISRTITENSRYGLDKPYEFDGGWGPDQIEQLNEMLTYLFRSVRHGEDDIIAIQEDDSGGDVVGPSSATDDRIATFDGTTGKLIQDGGTTIALLATLSGVGNLTLATTNLSLAQLTTIDTTPVTVVSAGGANTVVVPICWAVETNTTTASGGPAPTYRLRYDGIATNLADTLNSSAASSQTRFHFGMAIGQGFDAATPSTATPPVNKGLTVGFSLDIGATFVGTARVFVLYYVAPTAF